MLNKQKGNMYPWVTHTWNVIKGKCPHDCSYCYMKRYPQPKLHFDEKELKTDLGHGNFIFVGSSCDMWAEEIPNEWIAKVLKHCRDNDVYNRYLFQTKNPLRFQDWIFPDSTTLGTTIESNHFLTGTSPAPSERYKEMCRLFRHKMVSIEPIIDFDLDILVGWIKEIQPEFVSIGADSGGNNLPEPSPKKVAALIEALKGITEVRLKANLKRLSEPLRGR
jgi:hypothetical protein